MAKQATPPFLFPKTAHGAGCEAVEKRNNRRNPPIPQWFDSGMGIEPVKFQGKERLKGLAAFHRSSAFVSAFLAFLDLVRAWLPFAGSLFFDGLRRILQTRLPVTPPAVTVFAILQKHCQRQQHNQHGNHAHQ